jgi:hypothetical protein
MKKAVVKESRRTIAWEREEKLCLFEELPAHCADSSLLLKTLKISPATYYHFIPHLTLGKFTVGD